MKTLASIIITPQGVTLNGQTVTTTQTGDAMLTECYRKCHADYPKYFKMDALCRLGFVASELLLQTQDEERFVPREDRAIVLASCHGCAETDRRYQATIQDADNYFPSPAVFVYTLPNIVTGEIAIRNKYLGETSMFLFEDNSDEDALLGLLQRLAFQDMTTTSALTGWIDYVDSEHFIAKLYLLTYN